MLEIRYREIAENLKNRIDQGDWQKKLPGISVLSQEYEANPRTIAKALKTLSDKGIVTVRGTKGTFISRRNHRKKFNVIGVIGLIHEERGSNELIEMEELALAKGYHMACIDSTSALLRSNTHIFKNLPMDGLIFTNSLLTLEIIADLRETGIPFVSVNRISEVGGVNWVDFDTEKGYQRVYDYLLSLGHRRIAFIAFGGVLCEHETRMKSLYRSTMEKAGCYDPVLYVQKGNHLDYFRRYGETYYDVFGAEQANFLMNLDSPPTAVVTSNVHVAEGFSRYVRQMELDVPNNISVVAIGQDRQEADREPFFSMLVGSAKSRARRATEILLNLLEESTDNVTQELIPMELLEKQSVKPFEPKNQ